MKTSALMRRKQAGLPLEDNEYVPLIKRGSRQWAGLPLSIQPEENAPPPKIEPPPAPTPTRSRKLKGKNVPSEAAPKPTTTATVTTQKTTLAHQATFDARNKVLKVTQTSLRIYCFFTFEID